MNSTLRRCRRPRPRPASDPASVRWRLAPDRQHLVKDFTKQTRCQHRCVCGRLSLIRLWCAIVTDVRITAGPFVFTARFERAAAPRSCAKFAGMLPYRERLIHVRWSGEACWIPLGDLDLGLGYENATSFPAPGQLLLHPGGVSETEILLAYGSVRFASKVGQLAGNHFLTIVEGLDQLPELGRLTLWHGAQPIAFAAA